MRTHKSSVVAFIWQVSFSQRMKNPNFPMPTNTPFPWINNVWSLFFGDNLRACDYWFSSSCTYACRCLLSTQLWPHELSKLPKCCHPVHRGPETHLQLNAPSDCKFTCKIIRMPLHIPHLSPDGRVAENNYPGPLVISSSHAIVRWQMIYFLAV